MIRGRNVDMVDAFVKRSNDTEGSGGMPPISSTFVSVRRLDHCEILLEVDAIAVIE